jgi:putative sugar O-methyltransferase
MLNEILDAWNTLKDSFWKISDYPLRIRNYGRRKNSRMALFSNKNELSDSQVTFYENSVRRIIKSKARLRRFRRIYDYREILEHVDYPLGKKYLAIINEKKYPMDELLNLIRTNECLGRPRKYVFPSIGPASPTTLRYIAVAADIQDRFGEKGFDSIAEIGGGYGGQVAVLGNLRMFNEYFVYDLPSVQYLIKQYLAVTHTENVDYGDLNVQNRDSYDFVISNYAFSELPRQLQLEYLEKVILKSRNGYMLMNSGIKNETGRSEGKLTLDELKELIPNLVVSDEIPLTSPDNYLITWAS